MCSKESMIKRLERMDEIIDETNNSYFKGTLNNGFIKEYKELRDKLDIERSLDDHL